MLRKKAWYSIFYNGLKNIFKNERTIYVVFLYKYLHFNFINKYDFIVNTINVWHW